MKYVTICSIEMIIYLFFFFLRHNPVNSYSLFLFIFFCTNYNVVATSLTILFTSYNLLCHFFLLFDIEEFKESIIKKLRINMDIT